MRPIPQTVLNVSMRRIRISSPFPHFTFIPSLCQVESCLCLRMSGAVLSKCDWASLTLSLPSEMNAEIYPKRQGVTNRCQISWLSNSALLYEPKYGEVGGGGGCGVSVNEYSCAHGAQINYGDLTPYFNLCSAGYITHYPSSRVQQPAAHCIGCLAQFFLFI
jgi:hypothetical protein